MARAARYLCIYCLSSILQLIVISQSTIRPPGISVKVGDSAILNCSEPASLSCCVVWNHNLSNDTRKEVFSGEELHKEYKQRFQTFAVSDTGVVNLGITNVRPEDAGVYECQGDFGNGEMASERLIVLDSDPICESNLKLNEVIGENSCNIPHDEIRLSCSVAFYGDNVPVLEWRRLGDNDLLKSACAVTGKSTLTCTVEMIASMKLNGTSYICQIANSAERRYSCVTDVVKVLYALSDTSAKSTVINTGDKVVCMANSSQHCTYKWKWFEKKRDGDEDILTMSNNSTLTAEVPGSHRCEVTCKMRNQSCLIIPMFVKVSSLANTDIPSTRHTIFVTSLSYSSKPWLLVIFSPLFVVFWEISVRTST